jgi:hypothetical protein
MILSLDAALFVQLGISIVVFNLWIGPAHLNGVVTRAVAGDVVAVAIGLHGAAADTWTLLLCIN